MILPHRTMMTSMRLRGRRIRGNLIGRWEEIRGISPGSSSIHTARWQQQVIWWIKDRPRQVTSFLAIVCQLIHLFIPRPPRSSTTESRPGLVPGRDFNALDHGQSAAVCIGRPPRNANQDRTRPDQEKGHRVVVMFGPSRFNDKWRNLL